MLLGSLLKLCFERIIPAGAFQFKHPLSDMWWLGQAETKAPEEPQKTEITSDVDATEDSDPETRELKSRILAASSIADMKRILKEIEQIEARRRYEAEAVSGSLSARGTTFSGSPAPSRTVTTTQGSDSKQVEAEKDLLQISFVAQNIKEEEEATRALMRKANADTAEESGVEPPSLGEVKLESNVTCTNIQDKDEDANDKEERAAHFFPEEKEVEVKSIPDDDSTTSTDCGETPLESFPDWIDSFVRRGPKKQPVTSGNYEPQVLTPQDLEDAPPTSVTELPFEFKPAERKGTAYDTVSDSHLYTARPSNSQIEQAESSCDTFIRRQDSRTLIGPSANRSTEDQEMVRVSSLSCFRDVSSFVAADEETEQPQYIGKNTDVPVIIVTSEVNPFSKTGGLALVSQSYGMEFPRRGHRTMVVAPMYDYYPDTQCVGHTNIWLMGGETEVKFFHQAKDHGAGVTDYVFIDHPSYHRPGGLYCNAKEGVEYEDNLFRFALLSLAALEVPKLSLGGKQPYGEKVVFMANDWQAALLPVYLVHRHRPRGEYKDARCLFVVHNFGFQGVYPLNKLVPSDRGPIPVIVKNIGVEDLGLDPQFASNDLIYVHPEHDRSYAGDDGHVLNLSKAALMTSDRILTVSPGYAEEMKTVEGGFRLQDVVKLRQSGMAGILNGIDVAHWNPNTDPLLSEGYGTTNFVAGRKACKKQLQERLNLRVDPDVALVAFVGRLAHQKGIDIILEAVDWLMTDTGNGVTGKVQIILMGHGDVGYGEGLRNAENKYKGLVCGYVGFDPDVEHMIYGGSDLFFMPSRYEPCGLPQMYAMRYGCVPIVTLCGGLKDSVVTDPPEEATGFGISPLTSPKFKEVTYEALVMFHKNKEEFQAMQLRGMKKDFSWCRALDQYEEHIDIALWDRPYVH